MRQVRFCASIDIDRVEDRGGQNVGKLDQLLTEAAGVVKLRHGGVQLLRFPVRRLQRQRHGGGGAALVSRADNQRSAVRAGNRARDGKAEAGVGVDGLHLAARLRKVHSASETVARRRRVVDFNDGDGGGGKKRKGNFGSLLRVAHGAGNQIVNRARQPVAVRPDVNGLVRQMQRDGAPAGPAERLRLRENALQKCAQLQLFQPHLEPSFGDGGHFRQIAHQPQQLIKALVETGCGAAERRVLHLLERDKKRR